MIWLSKSTLTKAEKRAVLGVLDREYLGMGEEVKQFEEALSDFFGRPAVCVANGTAALHLAFQAAGIGAGDEVLVQSLTYVASFQAISATGAKPVACDVDPSTLTLDFNDAAKRLTPSTKAVLPVHYAGGVGDIDGIYDFAERHGIRVVEDAAHAFGGQHGGAHVGSFGDIACFSFDGIKTITSGEGGCVVTEDQEIINKVRDARLLGVERDTERRYAGERSWDFDVTAQGWRYHMSNIMAAIGMEQLKRISEISQVRQKLASRYNARLNGWKNLRVLPNDYTQVVPHIYPVILEAGQDRNKIREALDKKEIQTGVHYQPNHWLTAYVDDTALPLPATEAVYPKLLSLPLHLDMSEKDVDYVCETLQELTM